MTKFHISKDGTARQCRAQTPDSCKATPSNQKEHYETKEEAQKAYEKNNSQSSVKSLNKNDNSFTPIIEATFEERVEKLNEKVMSEFPDHYSIKKLDNIEKKSDKTIIREDYNDSVREYNKFLDHRYNKYDNDKNVPLEELSDEVKAGEEFVYHSQKMSLMSDENMEMYLKNIRLYKNSLNLENKSLRKEIEKVEKSGRIRGAFDKDFKSDKESQLATLNSRLKNNRSAMVKAIVKDESVAAALQNKRLSQLENKGFGIVSQYNGMNMSMHPKGPEFKYSCPNCGIMHTNRLRNLQYIKDTGFVDACRSCRKKMILPVTNVQE